jgi:protein-S-isoprenylcysteine O-methyltransferase Ste14
MLRKAIVGITLTITGYGVFLFLPAWTLDWWRAWVYLGVFLLVAILTFGWLYRNNQPLLAERLSGIFQKGQPPADRALMVLFVVLHALWIAFIPLDVFYWHLLPKPDVVISSLGMVLYLFGSWIVFLAMRDNTFASPAVKHQESREHHVVDTGVYAVIRHPMYAGFLPLVVGASLWLESYAGALVGVVSMLPIVFRIFLEESFLREKLPGYDAYMQRVRYRLIPFVW